MNIRLGLSRVFGCVIFVLVLFAGDRYGARFVNKLIMSTSFRYAQLYKGELPAEVVVLGNSRGLHMLHPPTVTEITGRETVNVSFNALPTQMMPVIWADYLDHHPSPRLLLFEISCVNRGDEDGAMELFTTFMDQSPRICELLKKERPQEYACAQFSHLYRYNNEFLARSMFFRNRADQSWIMEGQATDDLIRRMIVSGAEPVLYSQSFVDSAQQVIDLAEQHDVQVELFIGPFHPDYQVLCYDMWPWMDWLEEKLGRQIHDYSSAISDDDAFADHMHLNLHGTRQLTRLLKRDGLL